MLDYFSAYEKHEEKETAIALPDKYGFYISYNDSELKKRVFIDHRTIPLSIIKIDRKYKSDDVLVTIKLKETIYKFRIEYKDYFKYIKPALEPDTTWPEPAVVKQVKSEPETINYTGGYMRSKKDFRRYIDEFYLSKGFTPEQLDANLPDWRKSYY